MITWFQLSSVFVTGYTGKVIVSIKEDNVELSREASLTAMTAGSYWHDQANERLYLWPTYSDNPNSNGRTYVFYIWQGFADEDGMNFAIQGEAEDYYLPAIDAANTPPLSQSITELFTGDITLQFGDIKLTYPEWWFANKDNYIFPGSEVVAKVGIDSPAYASYNEIFHGSIKGLQFQETGATLNLVDLRERLYTTIPPDRYLTADFPYIATGWHYQARVILLGEKAGIEPPCINTSTRTYEVSQVEFSFYTFTGIGAITAVYKAGVLLTPAVDYTTDLVNGRFTLTASPGTSTITCDAKGLKLGRDFSGATWNDTYSANIADITYFMLRLQGIAADRIDESTFETLQTARQYLVCGDWICQQQEFTEKLKELQPSGRFHLLPAVDGTLEVILYSNSVAPAYTLDEFQEPVITVNTDQILDRILLRYDKTPVLTTTETEGMEKLTDYQLISVKDSRISHKYQQEQAKNFKTIVIEQADGEACAQELLILYGKPWEIFTCVAPQEAMTWTFLRKVALYYWQIIAGVETYIYSGESFLILGKVVNWAGGVQLTLLKDPSTPALQPIDDHNFNHVQDHNLNEMQT